MERCARTGHVHTFTTCFPELPQDSSLQAQLSVTRLPLSCSGPRSDIIISDTLIARVTYLLRLLINQSIIQYTYRRPLKNFSEAPSTSMLG